MRRVACVFPGQGAQQVGMGRELAAESAFARVVFEEADAALGFHLSRLCFEGPADTLQLTEHAQPAILTASVAAWRVLHERTGLVPVAVAGHSLGEWSALVAAEVLSLADAVRAVRERGRLMQEAVPVGEGAMAALLGVDAEVAARLCAEAAENQIVSPANLNGGGQVVVAGHTAAVERLMALARAEKIRSQRLAVSAPFHCALMAPAARGMATVLAGLGFHEPKFPVVTSVAARTITGAGELPALLAQQITAPVRWEETAQALARMGVTLALEVGPGQALRGLFRRIVPELSVLAAGDPQSIAAAAEALA